MAMVAQISESSPVVGLVFVIVFFNGLFLITYMWGGGGHMNTVSKRL